MAKYRRTAFAALMAVVLLTISGLADDLSVQRAQYRSILKAVASDVENSFYDPNLKGVDWKATVDQGLQRIDNAKSIPDMARAVFVVVEKLHDSHTKFLPPWVWRSSPTSPNNAIRDRFTSGYTQDRSSLWPDGKYKFGFDAKPIGDGVYVYEVLKDGAADKAGILPGDKILMMNGFNAERASYDLMMFDFRVVRSVRVLDLVVQRDSEPARNVHLEAQRMSERRVLDAENITGDIWDLINDSNGERDWYFASYRDGIGYAQYRRFVFDGEELFKAMVIGTRQYLHVLPR